MSQSSPRPPSFNPSTEQEWISTAPLAPKPGASTASKKRDGNEPRGRRLTRDELLPKRSLLGHYLSSVPVLRTERDSSRHILNSTSSLASTEITGIMAEAIGIASGLLALGQFAFQSSIALYETINSYQSHQQRVRELAEETGALGEVLGSLVETVKTTTDIDLSSLELPLRQCGKACQNFEQQIKKVSSRSTGTRASLRDWAKLRYMGEDMDGFRRLLSGYKMTITIALTDANLRRSAATADNIEGYNDLINSAREQFEDRLEGINEKLDELLGKNVSDPSLDTSELMQIKEEKLSTEKSLAIVAQLSSRIAELQVQFARDPAASTTGSSDKASISERITHEGLQECQHSLTRMAAKLKEHERVLFNRLTEKMKASSSSPEEAADIARLREEWESTFESMNILSKAGSYFEKETSVIENHATGDAHQIMVATDEKTLHGTNRGLGWRSRQIGGRMNDETVRQISRDMVTVTIRNVYDEQPPARKGTPTGPADREPVGRHTGFYERYGEGFKLTSMK